MDSYILMNGLCNQSVDCVSKEIRRSVRGKKNLEPHSNLLKKD